MTVARKSGSAKGKKHINLYENVTGDNDKASISDVKIPPIHSVEGGALNVFFQLVAPFRLLFGLDIGLYVAATILNGLLPFLIGALIDAIQIDFNNGSVNFGPDAVKALFIFICVGALSVVLYRANAFVLAYFEPDFRASARARLTNYTLARSVSFLSDKFAGRLAHAINEITRASQAIIDHIRWSIIEPFLTAIILLITALTVHPYFSALLLVWLVLFIGGILLMTLGLNKLVEDVARQRGQGSALITDTVVNFLSVKMFAATNYEMDLLCKSLDGELKSGRRFLVSVFWIKMYQAVLEILLLVGGACLVWYLWQQQDITLGQISLVLTSSLMVTDYLWSFSSQVISLAEDTGSLSESLDQINEDKDKVIQLSSTEEFKPEKGEIVFNNLSFAYNADAPLFKGFHLHIKAGEKVGVVGPSGSGKTTLVKLLLRFYDVGDQEIMIDRQNVGKLARGSVRQNIAVIPQDANLFNRSVLENIRYGRLDASDEEVYEAAKLAYAHDFIEKLPEGYNTMLGDRGTKLSGGQRQRIAIARAILKESQILILDEATSALDTESEVLIQKALQKIMKGRTVVAIAHRLSTIADMDRIIVMQDGEVVEDGSHEELLKKKGRYFELWSAQSGSFIS